jgi:hypothetical protein
VGRGRDDDDADLALALVALVKMAQNEGFRYDGFWGWERTAVGDFIETNAPRDAGR